MVELPSDAVEESLSQAGLDRSALIVSSHPDNGSDCLRLEATIQQYGVLLVALAGQCPTSDLCDLADQAQLQLTRDDDTIFWLPGVEISERRG